MLNTPVRFSDQTTGPCTTTATSLYSSSGSDNSASEARVAAGKDFVLSLVLWLQGRGTVPTSPYEMRVGNRVQSTWHFFGVEVYNLRAEEIVATASLGHGNGYAPRAARCLRRAEARSRPKVRVMLSKISATNTAPATS